jgi:hypothetical protein
MDIGIRNNLNIRECVRENVIGAVNFEYGNFKNGNFDTNLSSKNRSFACLQTSNGNFKFSIENGNFKNIVGNSISRTGYVFILLSLQTSFVPRLCV